MKSLHLIISSVVCLFMALLPVFYVLSLGPVVWIDSRYPIPEPWRSFAEAFYAPLGWLAVQNASFMNFLEGIKRCGRS